MENDIPRNKTSVAREHTEGEISVTSHVQICFCFLLKWTQSGKEVIYGQKNGGHRALKREKSLRSSQSDCLFASGEAVAPAQGMRKLELTAGLDDSASRVLVNEKKRFERA